ncbi:glycosyltransferase family 2 protein [Flavobacterium sp. 14A]|uniref:glycosyltransferase family 2 protein n=1 Tax=Flavobacterium sp. 14A TaxID=2735896 RepID=UPI001571293C|nr:glycosyltransferase family 2 protein [Flavobacterium sp. 14A]NRT13277.1 glycosyltransferase involved in cell wall biosynthesis [Flavobacterium sp. 14A]
MISIIIPVYNAEQSIEIAVKSILDQTFTDYEIIIIDDGSIDKSYSIAQNLAKTHGFLRCFSQENSGVTAARKKGFMESSGEFIMFLDADDKLKQNCLEILFTKFTKEIDIVNGSVLGVPDGRLWIHKKLGPLTKQLAVESILMGTTFGYLYASLYRREVLQEDVFGVDDSFKIGEDVLMKMQMCKHANKVYNLSDIVYEYINNEMSAMNTKVIHPEYQIRYMAKRTLILENFREMIDICAISTLTEVNDANKMVRQFFSPLVKFDTNTFLLVEKYKVNSTLKESYLLDSKLLTMIYKIFKAILFRLKQFLLARENNCEVIY